MMSKVRYRLTMATFVRRAVLPSLLVFIPVLGAAACSSSDDAGGDTAAHDGADSGGDAVDDKSVIVRFTNKYGFADGKVIEAAQDRKNSSVTILTTVDGSPKSVDATRHNDGAYVFADVPAGPYVLELRTQYDQEGKEPPYVVRYSIDDGARTVRLGGNYWTRKDTTPMTEGTKLALTVTDAQGFNYYDFIDWIGLHSYFYRSATFDVVDGQTNLPNEGDTTSSNWTFDNRVLDAPYGPEASGLPSAAASDDLKIIHSRSSHLDVPKNAADPIDRFMPWQRAALYQAIGVLDVASANFTNDTTNTVTGTLTAPPSESVKIDFHGSGYAAIRQAAGYSATTLASVTIEMNQEAGSGPEVYTSVGVPSWHIKASSKQKPLDLNCFSDQSATCSPALCAVGCQNALGDYVDPGDLTNFEVHAPRLYTTGMRDFFSLSYTFYRWLDTADGSSIYMSASVTENRARAGGTQDFSLQVGPVTDIRIDGKALAGDETTLSPGAEPTVTFNPPTLGNPEYYRVEVVDLTPDEGRQVETPRSPMTVATFYVRKASVKLPKGILLDNHGYYLRVTAVRDGWSFTEAGNGDGASFRTGIFTPPFFMKP